MFTRARRLNRRVQREHVGLEGDAFDNLHNIAHLIELSAHLAHFGGGVGNQSLKILGDLLGILHRLCLLLGANGNLLRRLLDVRHRLHCPMHLLQLACGEACQLFNARRDVGRRLARLAYCRSQLTCQLIQFGACMLTGEQCFPGDCFDLLNAVREIVARRFQR